MRSGSSSAAVIGHSSRSIAASYKGMGSKASCLYTNWKGLCFVVVVGRCLKPLNTSGKTSYQFAEGHWVISLRIPDLISRLYLSMRPFARGFRVEMDYKRMPNWSHNL